MDPQTPPVNKFFEYFKSYHLDLDSSLWIKIIDLTAVSTHLNFGFKRIIFVRHPFTRLVSAYRDKVLGQKPWTAEILELFNMTVSVQKWIDLKNITNSRPKTFSWLIFLGLSFLEKFKITLEQIFLTVGQNNYGNKIPVKVLIWEKKKSMHTSWIFYKKGRNCDANLIQNWTFENLWN
mgnify:CR=1 FL=1